MNEFVELSRELDSGGQIPVYIALGEIAWVRATPNKTHTFVYLKHHATFTVLESVQVVMEKIEHAKNSSRNVEYVLRSSNGIPLPAVPEDRINRGYVQHESSPDATGHSTPE